jgi:ABC-type glycerol-3-phosphate transport system substrate-binding protein
LRVSKRNVLLIVFLAMSLMLLSSILLAQANETIITITFPRWIADNIDLNADTFADFEAQHPGVKVVYVDSKDLSYISPPAYEEIDEYLTQTANLAAQGDVVFLISGSSALTLESTRAGLFLDMSPLITSDTDMIQEDFYPAAWSVYQWDRGIWGLPIALNPYFLVYDKAAFDAEGLAYPEANWSMDTLAHAQRTLLQENAEGQVVNSGLMVYGSPASSVLLNFLDSPLSVPGVAPIQPDFTAPETVSVIEAWLAYMSEGYLGGYFENTSDDIYNSENLPMVITQPQSLLFDSRYSADHTLEFTLLRDQVTAFDSTGFAISAGTQNPEMAYELIKFITGDIELLNNFARFDGYLSRYSTAKDPNNTSIEMLQLSDADFAMLEQMMMQPISPSDAQLAMYIEQAINEARDETSGKTLAMALEEAELKVITNLTAAQNYAQTQSPVAVITPVPTASLAGGEIALEFGVNMNYGGRPNEHLWDQLVDDFVANDPQVGRLTLHDVNGVAPDQMASTYDCFYMPYNLAQTNAIVHLLSLDPFMDTSVKFDRNDFMGSLLQQIQKDNRTWGYPLDIKPEVIWYHSERFMQDGIPAPADGWTLDAFIDALRTLKQTQPDDMPFALQAYGTNTSLLLLITAYGGLPFDYRTQPTTINLTAPETVDAIQQVITLVDEGYVQYAPIGPLYYQRDDITTVYTAGNEGADAMYTDSVNPFNFTSDRYGGYFENTTYQVTNYPRGSQYTPISYDIGAAYISASTQNADACYRWIETLSENPALFQSIPARRSQINDPEFLSLTGIELGNYMQQLDQIMNDPGLIELPSQASLMYMDATEMLNQTMQQIWFNEVLDNAIMDEIELEPALAQAQTHIEEYTACIAGLPPLEVSMLDNANALTDESIMAYTRCAVQTDPRLGRFFEPQN